MTTRKKKRNWPEKRATICRLAPAVRPPVPLPAPPFSGPHDLASDGARILTCPPPLTFLLLPLPSSLAPPRPPPPPPHRRLAASLVARPASSPPRPPLSIPCSQPLPSTSSVDPLRARPAAVGLAVSGSSRRCVPALQRAGSSGAEGLPPAARSEEQARGTIYW
jgi:hypothetical protein